jgi:TRAP transporter TAXI family solute receptor
MLGWDRHEMGPRVTAFTAIGASAALALGLLISVLGFGEAQSEPQRLSFLVATGPTGGTYFPVGQLIAGLISNPPGVDRCQIPNVCGPAGLVMSARTSDGAVANVLDVNADRVDSGLAQADVVAQAVKGTGIFRRYGKQTHIRVLAALFPEDVHVVVATHAKIASLRELRGKRVSLGADDSGTIVTARAVLAAYGLSERAMKTRHLAADESAQLLESGKLDAFFFVGGTPVPLLEDLISRGAARLVAVSGRERMRLIKSDPGLESDAIAANTYPGQPEIQTVRVRALWIVRDTAPDALVNGIVRALFNPSNRAQLDRAMPSTRAIRIEDAAGSDPALLHPGALRFYREKGKLPRAGKS